MRRFPTIVFAVVLLTVLLYPQPAVCGVETIAGTALGYGVQGPDDGKIWGHAWTGVKVKTFEHGVSLYTVGKYSGVDGDDVGGIGGEGFLIAKLRWPNWYGILGGGWLPNVDNGNTGATYKMGLAYALSDVFTTFIVLDAVDRGDEHSVNIHFGVGLDNLFGLFAED